VTSSDGFLISLFFMQSTFFESAELISIKASTSVKGTGVYPHMPILRNGASREVYVGTSLG